MITAVDTSVLLDVFGADPTFGPASRDALRKSLAEGGVIACDVVWAETAVFFPSPDEARAAMENLHVGFSPLDTSVALAAAKPFREYRRRGGSRTRIVADFLIGAHASSSAERLLTRDRGFYRAYFADLTILEPAPDQPPGRRRARRSPD